MIQLRADVDALADIQFLFGQLNFADFTFAIRYFMDMATDKYGLKMCSRPMT